MSVDGHWRSWTPKGRREGGSSRRTLGYFRMGVSQEYSNIWEESRRKSERREDRKEREKPGPSRDTDSEPRWGTQGTSTAKG